MKDIDAPARGRIIRTVGGCACACECDKRDMDSNLDKAMDKISGAIE